MSNTEKPKGHCTWCGGILVAVGSARANGADHDDWSTRKLHKRCYKEKKEVEDEKRRIEACKAVYQKLAFSSGRCLIDLSEC
tara:strand:- start:107 stop:352 length:246 start_codon:yes stop_codon:yes gene_type:complete